MENASKALLIAGGVLITMIVASLGVYLYSVYHEHSENMLAAMSEKEVTEFNSKFWSFEGRDLTANEVISILNLIRNNNKIRTGTEYKIEFSIGNVSGADFDFNGAIHQFDDMENMAESDYNTKCNSFISNYSKITKSNNEQVYQYVFKCKVSSYNENTKLVNNVEIQGKKNQ